MKQKIIHIKIETENDSFQEGNKNKEVARILRDIADQISYKGPDEYIGVSDINGNHVGEYTDYNNER